MMTCPKCGVEQKEDDACMVCGVIIEKYNKRMAELAKAAEAEERREQEDPDNPEVPERFLFIRELYAKVADPIEEWVGRYADMLDEKFGNAWREIMPSARRYTFHWFRGLTDRLVTLALSTCLIWMLCTALLHVAGVMWGLYRQLPMGDQYARFFPDKAGMIETILNQPPINLSLTLCLTALGVCVGIGAVIRLLFFYRWFYRDRHVFLQYIVWPAVCAAAGSRAIAGDYGITYAFGMILLFIPVLLLCAPCFRLAGHVLPELNVFVLVRQARVLIAGIQTMIRQG
ncbi:MAG: hypothetical protein SWH61_16420 [Thermodesulfobacteriota bacterium]|nr:hypothetical protein [Thermodesulfobacteriota bacterium]